MTQHEYVFVAVSIILGLAITRLLHTTGFDRIVPVREDLADAVAALDDDPDA